jgi:hypothetical protein
VHTLAGIRSKSRDHAIDGYGLTALLYETPCAHDVLGNMPAGPGCTPWQASGEFTVQLLRAGRELTLNYPR